MQLSVIIVNYNVRSFLENALLSIQKAMRNIEGEIFVVDNASDDGSVELIQAKFPYVKLIVNQTNLGFAAANNIALSQSSGKYILLINPDTIVQEDTLTSLIEYLENNPQIGLAGCKILNPDGSLQLACRRSIPTPWSAFTKVSGLSALFPNTKLFGKYNLTYLNPNETYEVEAVSGSFMFLRRDVYEQVGKLDESYFMYGEDLDWCYRIFKAGWKVLYYHKTQIIHYKGESTKQSSLDDIKMFYNAMHIFVRKHLKHSTLILFILHLAIVFRSWLASFSRLIKSSIIPLTDCVLINVSIVLGFYFRFGKTVNIPDYAFLPMALIPALAVVTTNYFSGGYNKHKHSITRIILSVIIGFTIISALTYFFKQFAFSRIVVIYSAVISVGLLSMWRLIIKIFLRYSKIGQSGFGGRRTLIVGTSANARHLLQKLRLPMRYDYNVVGFIDLNRKQIGNNIDGIDIIGSVSTIGKIIERYKISDVLFSTDELSYKNILSVIGRSKRRKVNYRMVPNSLEVIIGKTHIDNLNDLPLIEIDYKLDSKIYQITKRVFDIVIASVMFVIFFPFKKAIKQKFYYNLLPEVISGKYSLVGSPIDNVVNEITLLKPGLTGLAQIEQKSFLNANDVDKYTIFYLKNYSVLLDTEILIKWFFNTIRNK
ncbi:MAG: glycosyltransferase [Bacteroidota bacterium]|nr:glycosyltransferase [Bacteroidota bacterium]